MMRVFSDLSVCRYESPGHPEAPARVSNSVQHLRALGLRVESPTVRASVDDVLTVHTPRHWEAVQRGTYVDVDTPFFPGIDEIALTSVSGALSALEAASAGEPAFSLMRPPGHHAGRERVAGFCYVNNMAIACRRALARGKRVAVVDIDVHHGDGTESIAAGEKDWLVASLHQVPLYPGTGLRSNDNCLNFPLPPETGEESYLKTLAVALEQVEAFNPDLIGVSAGFDTYKDCPLAQMALEKETYEKIGRAIAALGAPRFALLEGGYAQELPELIENFLKGFGPSGNSPLPNPPPQGEGT